MKLSIIVAMTADRVIGNKNKLPWHLPEDLKHFKNITMGKPVIMGRKTYESIGRLLPGRKNIILSRNKSYAIDGAHMVSTLKEAIKLCEDNSEAFIIGGSTVYKEALPKADCLYLTIINKEFEGDACFPEFDLDNDFTVKENSTHTSEGAEKLSYTFLAAERIRR